MKRPNVQFYQLVIGLLLLTNALALYLLVGGDDDVLTPDQETVATVNGEAITREDWLITLEQRYGKQVLRDLINQAVTSEMAEQEALQLTEEDLIREWTLLRGSFPQQLKWSNGNEVWKNSIRETVLLEEWLTKDVVIDEERLRQAYEEQKSRFQVPALYGLSHIVVPTKEAAENVLTELEDGTPFDVIAMERSVDPTSTDAGGSLGFLEEGDIPAAYVDPIRSIKTGEWTDPIETDGGFAVVFLHEQIEGQEYSFEEVKGFLRRQLALEEMTIPYTVESFWRDLDVEWFYGDLS
ncbi:peptidyl-prolyl cis-trans isomerase [Bacillus fonticola]|uniref:peptidyl-prolyl cis-trans isomerase n=1 Tax=Bacillus fonticola TaxID=2728853 RepID=UPI001D134D45|nr:peptidyl-prolyl cis-trans isomerase [Bacillus fonticola]